MKKTQYVLYRHGANTANQHLCDCLPVAIVTAASRADACRTVRHDPPGRFDPYEPAYSVYADDVEVWANQRLSARPLSSAPKRDVRYLLEIQP